MAAGPAAGRNVAFEPAAPVIVPGSGPLGHRAGPLQGPSHAPEPLTRQLGKCRLKVSVLVDGKTTPSESVKMGVGTRKNPRLMSQKQDFYSEKWRLYTYSECPP